MFNRTPKLKLPRLYPYQMDIVRSKASQKIWHASRRTGKSTLGGSMCLVAALSGHPVGWCAPSFKNTRVLFRFCENAVAPLRKAGLVRVNRNEQTIEFLNSGGFLQIFSDENNTAIRGEHFKLFVVDEAARVSADTITDVIIPCLADLPDTELILISTANGLNHFWAWYQRAKADTSGYMEAWQHNTLVNPNKNIQKAYWKAKESLPERVFLQEWDGRFIEDGAGVFSNVRECATATKQDKAIEGHQYIIGADLARAVGGDNSVFSVIDTFDNPHSLVHQLVLNGKPFEYQVQRLRELYQRFNATSCIVESNSIGQSVLERLQSFSEMHVTGWVTTNQSKQSIIDGLAMAFERNQIAIPEDEDLINELLAFTATQLPSGATKFSSPSGLHDDRVLSLAIVWGAASKPERRAEITNAPDWLSNYRGYPIRKKSQYELTREKRREIDWN